MTSYDVASDISQALLRGGAVPRRQADRRQSGAVQVASFKTRVESAYGVCNQRLEL
jgi:hypothetical protein